MTHDNNKTVNAPYDAKKEAYEYLSSYIDSDGYANPIALEKALQDAYRRGYEEGKNNQKGKLP